MNKRHINLLIQKLYFVKIVYHVEKIKGRIRQRKEANFSYYKKYWDTGREKFSRPVKVLVCEIVVFSLIIE